MHRSKMIELLGYTILITTAEGQAVHPVQRSGDGVHALLGGFSFYYTFTRLRLFLPNTRNHYEHLKTKFY